MISVCIPYFNREKHLIKILQLFEKHGYAELGLEISICDDGSMEEPLDPEKLSAFPFQFRLSHLPKKEHWQNPCVPLNKAVFQATGNIILLQGAETHHPKPLLFAMMEQLREEKDIVLCPVKDVGNSGIKWRAHPVHQPQRLWFCQLMFRKFFLGVGGVDERFRDGVGGWDDNALEACLTEAGANWIWMNPSSYYAEHHHTGKKKLNPKHRASNKKLFEQYYPKHTPLPWKDNYR